MITFHLLKSYFGLRWSFVGWIPAILLLAGCSETEDPPGVDHDGMDLRVMIKVTDATSGRAGLLVYNIRIENHSEFDLQLHNRFGCAGVIVCIHDALLARVAGGAYLKKVAVGGGYIGDPKEDIVIAAGESFSATLIIRGADDDHLKEMAEGIEVEEGFERIDLEVWEFASFENLSQNYGLVHFSIPVFTEDAAYVVIHTVVNEIELIHPIIEPEGIGPTELQYTNVFRAGTRYNDLKL